MKLSQKLKVETLNGEVLVLDSENAVVHRLTGDAAAYVRHLIDEPGIVLPDNEITAGLVSVGIIEDQTFSRRRLVVAAASLVAMGVITLGLPNAVAASSVGGGGGAGSGGGATITNPTVEITGRSNNQVKVTWLDGSGAAVAFSLQLTGDGVNGGTVSGGASQSKPDGWSSSPLATWASGETLLVTITALASNTNIAYRNLVRTVTLTRP